MTSRYSEVLGALRLAYDHGAVARDEASENKPPWKTAEREAFLQRLLAEDRRRLLEIGAGTGQDSLFFKDRGLQVTATDLSPRMVERCRMKGLDAYVMDFLQLDFPAASFDAIYAFNSLLHVPNADLAAVLGAIETLMRPMGLFYVGVYGGDQREGPAEHDDHTPPRFFSLRSDDEIQGFVRPLFDIADFHVVELTRPGFHFQSLTLRRPPTS